MDGRYVPSVYPSLPACLAGRLHGNVGREPASVDWILIPGWLCVQRPRGNVATAVLGP